VDWGCALAPEELVTTLGASEALSLALRAITSPGDTVAVETPTYFGIWQLLASLELNVLEIPVHPSEGLDLEVLESVLDAHEPAAVIATPNFNNPLGCLMSDERKAAMARLLASRETPLIEDNIYGELQFEGPPPRPVKSFDTGGRVLLCGSLSKTLAPGYRIGWLAPGRYMAQVQALQRTHSIALPTLPQLAVADFLRSGGYDRHLRRLRRTLAVQVERMRAAVAEHFPAETRISRPQGGLVLWVELPTEIDTVELHEAAMTRGISFAPGMLFSARSRFRRCLRLSCGMPWSPQLNQAVATLGRLAKSMKPGEA
jgi:DNA-binding transcriptional MocR family regulator